MSDFVQDEINKYKNNPQILTQKEAKELQKEVGNETYQKMIQDNIIAIKELLQNNNKLENKSNKNEEQDKNKKEQDRVKAEQRHQQLISSLRSFSGDIKTSINSLTNTGLNKISDLLGAKIGMLAQAAFEAARVGVKLSFAIDKLQMQRNVEFLKSHDLSSAMSYNPSFVERTNSFYKKMLDKATDSGVSNDEMKVLNQELYSSMNMRKLNDRAKLSIMSGLYNLGNEGVKSTLGPSAAELYKSMIAQSGLSQTGAYANLNAFNRSFEFSSLGTEKSLQLSKQLFDSNRRFIMSINSAAGYINEFSNELQRGTSTLSDITSVRTTLKTKGSGDLAGLGQMMVNMGFGTPEMNKVAGNPFALASLLRKGDTDTINKLQETFDAIATGAGFGKGVKGRDEYLRNLYGLYGFSLNEDLVARVTQGDTISASDLGIKKKKGETPEQVKEREAKEFANLVNKVKEVSISAEKDYNNRMEKLLQEATAHLGKIQSILSSPGDVGNQAGGFIYDLTHDNKVIEYIKKLSNVSQDQATDILEKTDFLKNIFNKFLRE